MTRFESIRWMIRGFRQAQRALGGGGKAACSARRNRPRLEILEDRLTPAIRFIVPAGVPADNISTFHTLAFALLPPGIVSGDAIEIKQGSVPGGILNDQLPKVTDFTIRGEAGVGADQLEAVTLLDAVTIPVTRSDFKLQNLNLDVAGGTLTFQADATLQSDHIVLNTAAPVGILLGNNAHHVIIENNQIFGAGTTSPIHVDPARLSHNIIAGNFITSAIHQGLITYEPSAETADIIRDNTLVQTGGLTIDMVAVGSGIDGLTIQHNTFRNPDQASVGIFVNAGVKHLSIFQNTFDFAPPGGLIPAIEFNNLDDGLDTSASIIGNTFQIGDATGIEFDLTATGSFHALVQANDFVSAGIGISIQTNGLSPANVDLGGGTEGSEGANEFRFARAQATATSAAVVGGVGTGTVQAQNNLFNNLGAEAAVFDKNDDGTLIDVVTTGSVTGNTAYVQALFGRFLHRAADLTSANDGSGLVTQLNNGISTATIVNAISRSAESFGFVVNDLYHSILGRDPDSAGQTAFVNDLTSGATLELVKATFFSSQEYLNRTSPGTRALLFVSLLYVTVSGTGLAAMRDYQIWVSQIATCRPGRGGRGNSELRRSAWSGGSRVVLEFAQTNGQRRGNQFLDQRGPGRTFHSD